MGERAYKIVIRDGRAGVRYTTVNGRQCVLDLADGPDRLAPGGAAPDGRWISDPFVEGAYLVDFDRRDVLLLSCDESALRSALASAASAWPGWSVRVIESFREIRERAAGAAIVFGL